MTTDNIEVYYPDSDKEKKNPTLYVKIPKTKTDKPRSFTLEGEYYKIFKKYEDLRSKVDTERKDFFLQMQNGQCTKQVIGVNTFGEMPKKVAKFLGLDEPNKYTGHAWRRTSATLLVEGGADMATLKRHGGWRSDTVAEGYVESSKNEKRKIYNRITSSINIKASSPSASSTPASTITSANINIGEQQPLSEITNNIVPTEIVSSKEGLSVQLSNCSNITIQFHEKK